jgi:Fur family zinc uptake transcriptional regulator
VDVISSAEQKCADNGVKLTKRRKQVLTALVECNAAVSAYELTELCNQQGHTAMPAMSVYRILDFLEGQSLVHRLSTTNKYIACSHISCQHSHFRRPQFLICNDCTRVQEVDVTSETLSAIERVAADVGFNLSDKQLEVSGTCSDCK